MERSDEALVRACQAGDEAAWETLVRRYQRLVHEVPRRAGLDEQIAADVFQEVFLTLVRSLDSLEHPDRLSAWLVTIAKRTTWRHVRQQMAVRANMIELDSGADNEPDPDLLPEAVLMRLEEQHSVRTAVSQLDERCRRMITMLFYTLDAPSYGEVAAQLGLAEGSIGPIRARCLERLQRRLVRVPD